MWGCSLGKEIDEDVSFSSKEAIGMEYLPRVGKI